MARRHSLGGGSRPYLPVQPRGRVPGATHEVVADSLYVNPVVECYYAEDFLGDEYDATEQTLAIYDASSGGTPTTALLADEPSGVYEIALASTSEAELVGFTWGDQRNIRGSGQFYFLARVRIPTALTTAQIAVFGLASDVDTSTLDNVTRNVWFRLQASMALLTELDDGTTDTDDQSTGETLTADVFYWFEIEKAANGTVYFRIANADGSYWREVDTIDGSVLDTTTLQPVLLVQKTSGATQPSIEIDYVQCIWPRL